MLDTSTVYPTSPRDWEGALHTLRRLCATHGVNLIAIGNGTASRETDKLAADLIKRIEQHAPGTGRCKGRRQRGRRLGLLWRPNSPPGVAGP